MYRLIMICIKKENNEKDKNKGNNIKVAYKTVGMRVSWLSVSKVQRQSSYCLHHSEFFFFSFLGYLVSRVLLGIVLKIRSTQVLYPCLAKNISFNNIIHVHRSALP
jgi:hypothetical protein